ncbi:cryptochrome/photolyase family protein [Fluviispira multicolorata]|uniref:Deoxyribodipyrimidine photo-lyase n=1 Tax=Fluviispira multicolorata TaxID=2654512 RepID=A0A833JE80_9BACT|nr:deoxyribodipyrimidine photo-lyase [Fluviispira multicolorata]KAB8032219.1 deoxyribodipyrimidine photo-lyase [Fluviispira multicolorata]
MSYTQRYKLKYKKTIVWLRRDLRVQDNVALSKACELSECVIPIFIFDTNILNQLKNNEDRRVSFIFQTLKKLEAELKESKKGLLILYGDPMLEVPKIVKKLNIEAVFCNKDYEGYAKKRDSYICNELNGSGISFYSLKDQVIFEENEILNLQDKPYKVFTPYKNMWLKKLKEVNLKQHIFNKDKLIDLNNIKEIKIDYSLQDIGFKSSQIHLLPGREGALEKLKIFAKKIDRYHLNRDLFDEDGTSQLSVHLRFGTISIRELFCFADKHNSQGAVIWKNELIWREFYKMILCQFPNVENSSFKREYENIKWENNSEFYEKWCVGMTGYPIIDAAMRHFNKTGWMHNRLRMVVASFLCKDLLIDYKKGEKYFAENLLDYDLSANNGGWQWSASTGCDAQPYFRIFNPEAQSKKFDPNGNYIRQFCPELKLFDEKSIHAPSSANHKVLNSAKCRLGVDYPNPIIQHDVQRLKAIKLFK